MEKIRKFLSVIAANRAVVTVLGVIAGIILLGVIWGLLSGPAPAPVRQADSVPTASSSHGDTPITPPAKTGAAAEETASAPSSVPHVSDAPAAAAPHAPAAEPAPHGAPAPEPAAPAPPAAAPAPGHGPAVTGQGPAVTGHGPAVTAQGSDTQIKPVAPPGVAFVEASIAPLEYELTERFWGWRPNDIVNFTDNVNSYQLGVLEVTRRTVVQLTERISRTGSTASLNPNLENAMNWLMVTAQRYWFPSPESKYLESLEELEKYKVRLLDGKASFYTRADNLIPLLAAYEDLLGSCDENLVKLKEADGSDVAFLRTDDYFYYAKGVADSMARILTAVHHDFAPTLEGRHGAELLHHAIVSCQRAAAIDPFLIIDAGLDSIFANHRAHMAAPISHARFYLGQLIKTLST